jgi:MoxR-like ATPase
VQESAYTLDRSNEEAILQKLQDGRELLLSELHRVIVGQEEVIEQLLIVLFSGCHCLITGAPGLAKTRLIRSLAEIIDLDFKRIQFTPDLMPSDIIGTEIIDENRQTGHREMRFYQGPIFTNILLADEINRTPPKTQAALLEAMEEKQVTVAGQRRDLTKPFYVFATQNPIELEGTYPLPEAQLDRFMFNIYIGYLDEDDELQVVINNTRDNGAPLRRVFTGEDLLNFTHLVRTVPVAEAVGRYAVQLVQNTRPGLPNAPEFVKKYVGWGAGTRASLNIILAAKARALLKGRYHVSCEDIRAVAVPVLRHRVIPNFIAEADHVGVHDITEQLFELVPEPKSGLK